MCHGLYLSPEIHFFSFIYQLWVVFDKTRLVKFHIPLCHCPDKYEKVVYIYIFTKHFENTLEFFIWKMFWLAYSEIICTNENIWLDINFANKVTQ